MKKLINFVFSISFIFYLLVLVSLLFLGRRGNVWADVTLMEYMKSSSNFVPFQTINTYINAIFNGNINLDIAINNLVGNLILFLPMGIYLPYFFRRIKKASTFSIVMIILLIVIEVVQVVTRRGSFDIDDFILNMLGALIGFGIWKISFVQKLLK